MKFTILSHAGLLVEHEDVRIVCDPWLLGSCYWRSWWNFPEPDAALISDLQADYIYLTHLHWDHFHGPSLQKLFSPKTRVLVPKVPTRRMVADLNYLGFLDVVEMPHGTAVPLGRDFLIRSYQFGLGVDSGVVISGGGVNLFNCNDAKFFGLPLRQILRDYPSIDFIFRSHSSAGPIPFCVENYERLFPELPAKGDSADQFARCALHVGARYAVPFASNHCFLHKETLPFNSNATTPDDVRRHYEQLAERSNRSSECIVMPPGSSWSVGAGFDIRPFDFSARREYIDSLLVRHREELERYYEREDGVVADFKAFRRYFEELFHALPAFIRRRALSPIVIRPRDVRGLQCWLVDPRRGTVEELRDPPLQYTSIELHAAVLRDCVERRMFSVWTASKRLKIKIPGTDGLAAVQRWFTVLDLYELEVFPLARNFSPRALAVRLRRWREPLELAHLVSKGVLRRRALTVANLYPLKVA